jgi:heme exporter protein C
MLLSIGYLTTSNLTLDAITASINEVSLVFAFMNVITGSIWARIIWGIWWTWDYRLTSMFVCLLIYVGYLLLRKSISEPTQRARLSAAMSIFGCVDIVIVWKSIEWFRTQHPGPVLSIRTGGGNIDPTIETMVYSECPGDSADCGGHHPGAGPAGRGGEGDRRAETFGARLNEWS